MSSAQWQPVDSNSSEYEIVACAHTKETLNIVIVGPRPDPSGQDTGDDVQMNVSIVGGDALQFRGLYSSGSKRQSVYVGEFEPHHDSTRTLLIRLTRSGLEIFAATAAPMPKT